MTWSSCSTAGTFFRDDPGCRAARLRRVSSERSSVRDERTSREHLTRKMPYLLSFDGPILVVRFFGTVTERDLVGSADDVMAVEDRGRNSRPRLTDLRGVADSSIGYSEVASIADRVGG